MYNGTANLNSLGPYSRNFFLFNLRMEQITLKNENYCLNINIYFYLETSGGESSNLFLNVVHFLNTSVN